MSVRVYLKGKQDPIVVAAADKAEQRSEARPGTRLAEQWLICKSGEAEVARFRLDNLSGYELL